MMNTIKKININKLLLTLIIFLFALTTITPLIWMISTSFKVEGNVFNYPIEWIPQEWNALNNYKEVLSGKYNFLLYYWNSIIVTFSVTVLQLFVCSMGAYAFSKIEFKFRDILFLIILAAMMIPPQLTLVPRFMIARWLNLYDTLFALIIMKVFSPYAVFLLRQYMITIPESIMEAAKIDGANYWSIFIKIILPMSKPILSTLGILTFVWTWNSYLDPLVFIRSVEKYTIQLGIRQFVESAGGVTTTFYSLQMAGAVLAILPLFIIFILLQRQVIEGITVGAVKG